MTNNYKTGKYSEEERAYIIEHYATMGATAIAKLLNRKPIHVQAFAQRNELQLKKTEANRKRRGAIVELWIDGELLDTYVGFQELAYDTGTPDYTWNYRLKKVGMRWYDDYNECWYVRTR